MMHVELWIASVLSMYVTFAEPIPVVSIGMCTCLPSIHIDASCNASYCIIKLNYSNETFCNIQAAKDIQVSQRVLSENGANNNSSTVTKISGQNKTTAVIPASTGRLNFSCHNSIHTLTGTFCLTKSQNNEMGHTRDVGQCKCVTDKASDKTGTNNDPILIICLYVIAGLITFVFTLIAIHLTLIKCNTMPLCCIRQRLRLSTDRSYQPFSNENENV